MKTRGFLRFSRDVYRILIIVCALLVVVSIGAIYFFGGTNLTKFNPSEPNSEITDIPEADFNKIENGIHVRTGLIAAEGLMEVVNNCTTCHSAKLVTQNRMDKQRWKETIRWMQETQNLWDLGDTEKIIIDYLVSNYPPKKRGRRELLTNVEWYTLED